MTSHKLDIPAIGLRRDSAFTIGTDYTLLEWTEVLFELGSAELWENDYTVQMNRPGVYELSSLISVDAVSSGTDRVADAKIGHAANVSHFPAYYNMDYCSGASIFTYNTANQTAQMNASARFKDAVPNPSTVGGVVDRNNLYFVRYLGTPQDHHAGATRWDSGGSSSVTGVGTRLQYLEVTLSGTSTAAGTGVRVRVGVASESGTSTTAGTGTRARAAEVSASGTSTTVGDATARKIATVSAAGEADAIPSAAIKARGAVVSAGEADTAGAGARIQVSDASISGEADTTGVGTRVQAASVSVDGESTTVGVGARTRVGVGSISGEADTTAGGLRHAIAAVSVDGEAAVDGTPTRARVTGATATMSFATSAANTGLIITGALPSVSRAFSERLSELRPLETYQVGFRGDPSVNNTVSLSGSGRLTRSGSYSGPDYTLEGPANTGVSPVKLGFVMGDKVRLIGPVGGEPNDGKEYTFLDPGAMLIMEAMVYPDATEYEFVVLRRVS